jgi:hypothetical protein
LALLPGWLVVRQIGVSLGDKKLEREGEASRERERVSDAKDIEDSEVKDCPYSYYDLGIRTLARFSPRYNTCPRSDKGNPELGSPSPLIKICACSDESVW